MTWNTLHPEIRHIAATHLTPRQLDAFRLELAGWGLRQIALHLGVSRTAIRDRLDLAHQTLINQGVRQDGSGEWTLTREL